MNELPPLTQENIQQHYPDALAGKVFTREGDDYASYLVLHESVEGLNVPYTVQGDLLAAFDIEGPFVVDPARPDKGHMHGHYLVEDELKAHLPENVLDKVAFESESATFFAYTETREDGENLIEAIGSYILARGEESGDTKIPMGDGEMGASAKESG